MKSLPILPWIPKWRTPKMTASEVVTCMLFWIFTGFKTTKDLYRDLKSHYSDFFDLPCYKNFVESVNRYGKDALLLLSAIAQINCNQTGWRKKFIDATCIKVCHNKRIFHHKTCAGLAQRWMSTMGWFFGFKAHMIVDEYWNLLAFEISPGNTDDRKVVRRMTKKMTGTLIADAGYVSEKLRSDLSKKWILFLTNYKKNIKVLVTKGFKKIMKLRQIVETGFWMMKCWWNLVSSYARSVWGHFSRIIYNVLGYTIQRLCFRTGVAIS